jgi:protein MAK11
MLQTFSNKSHTSSVRCIASYKNMVASGGADDRIAMYDFEKRRVLDDLYVHDGTINTLAFVSDENGGSYLLSGGADGKINMIKSNNFKLDKTFQKAHKGSAVNHIAVHPSGKFCLSIGDDMTLRTWNLIKGRQAFATNLKNKSMGNSITSIEFSEKGDNFAICGGKVLEVWDTLQASIVFTKTCESKITAISWISDEDILIGMEDGRLICCNFTNDDNPFVCEIYQTRIKAMKYRDGFLATASSSGSLNLWKIHSDDKLELVMISGIEIGCRPISIDIIKSTSEVEIKSEPEDVKEEKTLTRSLKTHEKIIIEGNDDDEDDDEEEVTETRTNYVTPLKTKRKKNQKKSLSNKKSKV